MKQLLYLLSVMLLCTTACKESIEDYVPKEFPAGDASFLRVVNTASFPRRIDFSLNGTKMNGDSIGYLGSFPSAEFLRVPSGNVGFTANAPALGTDVYKGNFTFAAGTFNTLFLIDTLPTIDAYLITDQELVPPADSGKVYIRFVNVAKGAGTLSLANTTVATAVDTIIKNIGYKSHSPFIKVNSGAGQRFQMFLSGTSTKVGAEVTSVTLTANRMYTFYARGRVEPSRPTGYPATLSILTTR